MTWGGVPAGTDILGPSWNPGRLGEQIPGASPIKSPEPFVNYEFRLATIAKQHVSRKRHSENLAVAS